MSEKRGKLGARFWIVFVYAFVLWHLCDGKRYDGYKLIRVEPGDETQLNILSDLEEDPKYEIDFWAEPVANQSIDLLVPPHTYDILRKVMDALGIGYELHSDNVQYMIDHENDEEEEDRQSSEEEEEDRQSSEEEEDDQSEEEEEEDGLMAAVMRKLRRAKRSLQGKTIVNKFARHEEINAWLDEQSKNYPNLCSVETIGQSYEGRSMNMIRISSDIDASSNKPVLWIDAGIHAREWISPATAIYIIDKLLSLYGNDDVVTYLVDRYEWLILPVTNPDGYEYSHTEDRMWRKNRRPNENITDDDPDRCTGTDLNRNFDFKWNASCPNNDFSLCRSQNPCMSVYSGRAAFSERETSAVRDVLMREGSRARFYLTLHSYSQLWLVPWSCCDAPPADAQQLNAVVDAGMAMLQKPHNTSFRAGAPPHILYSAYGTSMDWAKAKAGIKYAFCIELRDKGEFGFILPQSQINDVGEEVTGGLLAALLEMGRQEGDEVLVVQDEEQGL